MNIAVLGAGNTGQIMAFDLAQKGVKVRLYTRSAEKAAHIAANGIAAEGKREGVAALDRVSTDMGAVLRGAELVCVTTTANAHKPLAEAARPFMEEGQLVVVFNGNWGAFEFHAALNCDGAPPVLVGETGTQIYIGSASAPGQVFIKQIKQSASFAMANKARTQDVLARLQPFFPQFVPAANIVETSLSSANAIVHAPVCLFNLSRIERGDDFLFYREGASRSVVAYVEQVDRERMAVMEALGLETTPMLDIINSFWPDKKNTLYDAILENPSYSVVKGPKSFEHRFMSEDLPYGIAPLAHLGRALDVPTPYLDSMLESFRLFVGRDYLAHGFCPNLDDTRHVIG